MLDPDSSLNWIVAQEGSRRNYSIPVAFHRSGELRLFYTDIWCRYGRTLLKNGSKHARALAGRFNGEIPGERVVSFTRTAIIRRSAWHLRVGPASREEMGHFWYDFGQWFDSCIERHLRNVVALNHIVREFRRRSDKFSRSSPAPVASPNPFKLIRTL